MIAPMRKVLILALVNLLCLAGCVGFGRGDVQDFISAPIPNEATNFKFKTNQDPTRIVWLKFDSSQAVAMSFAQSLAIDDSLFDNQVMTFNYDREPDWWWDGATAYQGTRETIGTKAYQMVIVPVIDDTVRVYLEVFEY